MAASVPNPYEPPGSPEDVPAGARVVRGDASRWSRLWAALIDGALLGFPVGMVPWLLTREDWHIEPFELGLITTLSRPVIWLTLNGVLLANSAQTIGKKVLGIQVVNVKDGEPASFSRLVALRFLPLLLIGQVPYLG